MVDGPGHRGQRGAPSRGRLRAARMLAATTALLALAACDEFSTAHVAQVCLRSAMKAAEPFGNQRERERTEAQLRQYCQAAAEGR